MQGSGPKKTLSCYVSGPGTWRFQIKVAEKTYWAREVCQKKIRPRSAGVFSHFSRYFWHFSRLSAVLALLSFVFGMFSSLRLHSGHTSVHCAWHVCLSLRKKFFALFLVCGACVQELSLVFSEPWTCILLTSCSVCLLHVFSYSHIQDPGFTTKWGGGGPYVPPIYFRESLKNISKTHISRKLLASSIHFWGF